MSETKATNEAMEKSKENGSATASTFQAQFKAFSKFGDFKSDGKTITLTQSDKWMKQAKVIDGKRISSTDTGIHFKKLKTLKVTLSDYMKFLEDLAKAKNIELEEMKSKLANCGHPGVTQSSSLNNSKDAETVKRLTDTSKYTGTHKQRFDDSGKGKGIAGRHDIADGSGYVTGYKNKDTYDAKH